MVVDPDEAEAVVWTSPDDPDGLAALLADHPHLRWVQLPFAGIEPYVGILDEERTWTCGKGVYAPPVAEMALALLLGGLRHLGPYSRAGRWTAPAGRNLLGARLTILGGGGITTVLLGLLAPFDVDATVVRRHPAPVEGARRVVGPDELPDALTGADGVVLALALTPETRGIIGAEELARLPDHACLVNVARGGHVDTDAVVAAFAADALGSAGLDVTDPEPLPDSPPAVGRAPLHHHPPRRQHARHGRSPALGPHPGQRRALAAGETCWARSTWPPGTERGHPAGPRSSGPVVG